MKITRHNDDALTIVDFPWLIGAIGLPVSLACFYESVATLVRGERLGETFGAAVGGLVFFFVAAVFTVRSSFHFDLKTRQLTWSRRGRFTQTGGVIAFDRIRGAVLQSINSDEGLSYRVTILTQSGEIPISIAYSGNAKKHESARDAINQALDLTVASPDENDIRELARSGRKIDAISLARTRYGYDLTRAKEFVEGLLR